MNEENNLNNLETNETQQEIAPQADTTDSTVEPVANPALEEPPQQNKKKSNPILIILAIIVLLCGVCYGLYQYTDIFKSKKNASGNETTTVTTTTEPTTTGVIDDDGEFPIGSFEDYLAIIRQYRTIPATDSLDFELIDLDNKYFRVDYDVYNKCKNEGDKVSLTAKSLNIEYTCTKNIIDSEDADTDQWDASILINGTYKDSYSTFSTCNGYINYSDGSNMLEFVTSCGMGGTEFSVGKISNNNTLSIKKYEAVLIYNEESHENTPALIKDNVLYFVEADEVEEDHPTTCRLKSIDLSKDTFTKKDLGYTTDCFYTHSES